MISNARMYAVTPEVEAAWRALLAHIGEMADVVLEYLDYFAPQPLENLWRRPDAGVVFMCGYPIRLGIADVQPIAAPVLSADWAQHRALYRSDLIVRADSRFETLTDTFGGRLGWTVAHSHSGFNALRHHLLHYRTTERPRLYGEVVGNLITARAVLDRVVDGTIDVGPLDAYWHHLLRRHRPDLTRDIRIVESMDLAPVPCFVASTAMPAGQIARLRAAFAGAARETWFAPLAEILQIEGFVPAKTEDYAILSRWQDEAVAAGYPEPA